MKNILFILLLFFISFFSCSKPLCGCTPLQAPTIKAVVIQTNNIDCNRPLIAIDNNDTARVRAITGISATEYIASQLPSSLKVANQKIYISIDAFSAGQSFACTTVGPAYPHLNVIDAIGR